MPKPEPAATIAPQLQLDFAEPLSRQLVRITDRRDVARAEYPDQASRIYDEWRKELYEFVQVSIRHLEGTIHQLQREALQQLSVTTRSAQVVIPSEKP